MENNFEAIKEEHAIDKKKRQYQQSKAMENLEKDHISALADAKRLGIAEWMKIEDFKKAATEYAEQNMGELAEWVFQSKAGREKLCRVGKNRFSFGKYVEQKDV